MKSNIFTTDDSKAIILIRLMTGVVFLSEGIQKFLFSEGLEAGLCSFDYKHSRNGK